MIPAKSSAPDTVRIQPLILPFTFAIRRLCSTRLLVKGMRKSSRNKKCLAPVSRQAVNETADFPPFDSSALSGLTGRNRILSGGLFEKGVIARPERPDGFRRPSLRSCLLRFMADVNHFS